MNLTRRDMVEAGYSPSVRLFEAAGCGAPIVSDPWPGLETFFEPGREILVAHSADDVIRFLSEMTEAEWASVKQSVSRTSRGKPDAG